MTLIALAMLRIALSFVSVPDSVLPAANGIVAMVFLGAPIVALFFAARSGWTPRIAGLFVLCGFVLQFGFVALAKLAFGGVGFPAAVCIAISQIGLPIWCVGLGALLATLVKDRNILIPIAIFLAVFDMFLVLTDAGPTKQILKHAPQAFEAVAMAMPSVQQRPRGGEPPAAGYAGPADFVFLAMFFIALYRFRMRTEETMRWVVPVLFGYLLLVGALHQPLPALVPIGLTVLIVNWREFRMTRDEKLSTALVACLGIGLLVWGATRPKPPAEPSPREAVRGAPESAGSPSPAPPDQRP